MKCCLRSADQFLGLDVSTENFASEEVFRSIVDVLNGRGRQN